MTELERQPGPVRLHVRHDDEGGIDGHDATIDDHPPPQWRGLAEIAGCRAIVGQPPLRPSRAGSGGARLDGLLDVGDESVALLTQEHLAVSQPDVAVNDLAVGQQVQRPPHVVRVAGCACGGTSSRRRDDAGQGRDRRRTAARAVVLCVPWPPTQMTSEKSSPSFFAALLKELQVGEKRGREVSARGEGVAQLEGRGHGLPVAGSRRDDDLDRPGT